MIDMAICYSLEEPHRILKLADADIISSTIYLCFHVSNVLIFTFNSQLILSIGIPYVLDTLPDHYVLYRKYGKKDPKKVKNFCEKEVCLSLSNCNVMDFWVTTVCRLFIRSSKTSLVRFPE